MAECSNTSAPASIKLFCCTKIHVAEKETKYSCDALHFGSVCVNVFLFTCECVCMRKWWWGGRRRRRRWLQLHIYTSTSPGVMHTSTDILKQTVFTSVLYLGSFKLYTPVQNTWHFSQWLQSMLPLGEGPSPAILESANKEGQNIFDQWIHMQNVV